MDRIVGTHSSALPRSSAESRAHTAPAPTAGGHLAAFRHQFLPCSEAPRLVEAGITLQASSNPRVDTNLIPRPASVGSVSWFDLSQTSLRQFLGQELGFDSSFFQETIYWA